MEGYPKSVHLRGGAEVTVRPLAPGDFDGLLAFFRALPAEDRLFLKDDVTDERVVRRFFAELDYRRVLPLLALEGGRVIGDGTLHRAPSGWTRHVGEIRVVIAPGYRKRGLGTAMVRELVAAAATEGLERLEAQVLADQTGALRAFEALGFRREAVLKEHACDLQDHRHDLIILTTGVADLWRSLEDLLFDQDVRRSIE